MTIPPAGRNLSRIYSKKRPRSFVSCLWTIGCNDGRERKKHRNLSQKKCFDFGKGQGKMWRVGDTETHEQIETKLIEIVSKWTDAQGATCVPEDDAWCLELGNWMTDWSQFRDPTAFMSGKIAVWNTQRNTVKGRIPFALEGIARLDDYLDDLFGKPGQDGALAKWAKQVALSKTINHFCLEETHKLDVNEVQSIFEPRFTQYYPHEHVDFPPWPWDDIIGDRTPSSSPTHSCATPPGSGAARKIGAYTEEQLVYISDLLTSVQERWKNWVATQSQGSNTQTLHEILCDYGHASHAAEDFFFHSNFAEVAWQTYRTGMPPDAADIRHQRLFARRLKAPLGKGSDLDTSHDAPDAPIVYTGYFGPKDVAHSLTDAVQTMIQAHKDSVPKSFEQVVGPLKKGAGGSGGNAGSGLDTDGNRRATQEEYRKLQASGALELALQEDVKNNKLHPKAADAMRAANQIDLDLMNKHKRPGVNGMGVVGFVIQFLGHVDEDRLAAAKVAQDLDAKQTIAQSVPTDNGCLDENIGSHSLISKDSVLEGPVRPQALSLAMRETRTLIITMLCHIYPNSQSALDASKSNRDTDDSHTNTMNQAKGIDWLHALQHFICHPTECESKWCDKAMDDPEANPNYDVNHIEQDETDRRAKQEKRGALEQKYKDGETYYQKKWVSMVTRDTLLDAGLLILAGAVIGAIIGGLAGGVKGAVIGAVIGAVAGAALALIGALAGVI